MALEPWSVIPGQDSAHHTSARSVSPRHCLAVGGSGQAKRVCSNPTLPLYLNKVQELSKSPRTETKAKPLPLPLHQHR